MPYLAQKTTPNPSADELRARIPGWGTDLDPADRHSHPYERFDPSEARAAHWLLLILADRVDALEHHARSLFTARPDNPVTQTGVLAEPRHRPMRSRFGRGRADLKHMWLDPILVAGPWLLVGGLVIAGARAFRKG